MSQPTEVPEATALVVPAGPETQDAERLHTEDPEMPAVGRWYVVNKGDAKDEWIGCVVRLGSNYVKLETVTGGSTRIHVDKFWDQCTFLHDPDALIAGQIDQHQRRVHALMEEIKVVTARLAIAPNPLLGGGDETRALALHRSEPMDAYKAALVKAKEETLPDLFKAIKHENEQLATWMGAKLIPLKAQAAGLKPAIRAVEDRIFSVQLYAGLVEDVEQIADGDPASLQTPVHLLQRRCYMDEECLARYEVGGMDYKGIGDFDRWLRRPTNRDRILPFPRCIVAFQVRRERKDRGVARDISAWWRMQQEEQLDNLTFLYIRNGDQLYRLSTEIEFGRQLFPDADRQLLGKTELYAKVHHLDSDYEKKKVISVEEWQTLVADEARQEREIEEKTKANAKLPKDQREHFSTYVMKTSNEYTRFTKDSVRYDDIAAYLHNLAMEHNRLVLVLQGLLDRSPVLHPHPPWQLWSAEGFAQALVLVHDDSRGLVAGAKPDFRAYRERLNASMTRGSVTIGQQRMWLRVEAAKEHARRRARGDRYAELETFHPSGNDGPGTLAYVARFNDHTGQATFQWTREQQPGWRSQKTEPTVYGCALSVPRTKLFNVSAYTPGDFKQFFEDPRTRAEYLQWAPLLLEAEEYHAGNRPLEPPKEMPAPKPRKPGGDWKYQLRKKWKALIGQAVRNRSAIETRSNVQYKKGLLWRVDEGRGGEFTIVGILPDGTREPHDKDERRRAVRCMRYGDLEIDTTIPPAPDHKPEPKRKREKVKIDDDDGYEGESDVHDDEED